MYIFRNNGRLTIMGHIQITYDLFGEIETFEFLLPPDDRWL